jgi:hypothetical protein
MVTRLNVTRARQGRPGKPIVWVLGISTVLAAAVLFGAWAMRSNDFAAVEANNGDTPAAAQNFSTPEPTPRQNTTTPPPARPG